MTITVTKKLNGIKVELEIMQRETVQECRFYYIDPQGDFVQ
jgi:hypothetical protein